MEFAKANANQEYLKLRQALSDYRTGKIHLEAQQKTKERSYASSQQAQIRIETDPVDGATSVICRVLIQYRAWGRSGRF